MEESRYYIKLLRELGDDAFVRETLEAKKITAKKLLTAFNARVPTFLDGQPDVGAVRMLMNIRLDAKSISMLITLFLGLR